MEPVAILVTNEEATVVQADVAARRRFSNPMGKRCTDVVALRDSAGRPICSDRCAATLASQPEGSRTASGASRGMPLKVHCVSMGTGTTVLVAAERVLPAATPLSPREHEVMALVAEGLTARRIAKRLGVRESTVRTHLDHAKTKLGARTLPEAASRLRKTEPPASEE